MSFFCFHDHLPDLLMDLPDLDSPDMSERRRHCSFDGAGEFRKMHSNDNNGELPLNPDMLIDELNGVQPDEINHFLLTFINYLNDNGHDAMGVVQELVPDIADEIEIGDVQELDPDIAEDIEMGDVEPEGTVNMYEPQQRGQGVDIIRRPRFNNMEKREFILMV